MYVSLHEADIRKVLETPYNNKQGLALGLIVGGKESGIWSDGLTKKDTFKALRKKVSETLMTISPPQFSQAANKLEVAVTLATSYL